MDSAAVYDAAKLAKAVSDDLGDKDWGTRLLDKAAEAADDYLALAQVGCLKGGLGDDSTWAFLVWLVPPLVGLYRCGSCRLQVGDPRGGCLPIDEMVNLAGASTSKC